MLFHIIEPEWLYDETTKISGHIDSNYLSAGGFPSLLHYLVNYSIEKLLQMPEANKIIKKFADHLLTEQEINLLTSECINYTGERLLTCLAAHNLYAKTRLIVFSIFIKDPNYIFPAKLLNFLTDILEYLKLYGILMNKLKINNDIFLTWEADLGYGAKAISSLQDYQVWHDLYNNTNLFSLQPYFQLFYNLGRNKRDKLKYLIQHTNREHTRNPVLKNLLATYDYKTGEQLYLSKNTFPYAYIYLTVFKEKSNLYSINNETDLYWYFSSIFNAKTFYFKFLDKYNLPHIDFKLVSPKDLSAFLKNNNYVIKVGHTISTGGHATFIKETINKLKNINVKEYPLIVMPKLKFFPAKYSNQPLFGHIRVLGIVNPETRQIFHVGFLIKLSFTFNTSGYKSIFAFYDKNMRLQVIIDRTQKVPTIYFEELPNLHIRKDINKFFRMAYEYWRTELQFMVNYFTNPNNIQKALQYSKYLVENNYLCHSYNLTSKI